MTQLQKLVKYVATAVAVILIVNIFLGIIAACAALGFLFESFGGDSAMEYDMPSSEKSEFSADTLEIELDASRLVIKEGKSLSAACSDGSVIIKESGGTLKIIEEEKAFDFKNSVPETVISVPDNTVFKSVYIESGAGKISIDSLSSEKIRLKLGAGSCKINRLSASSRAEISVGAGKLDIKSADIRDLRLDIGVGSAALTAILSGDSSIYYGVGNADITLIGNQDDYKIGFEKGISRAYINGKTASAETSYGDGDSLILIDGGIGSVSVDFSTPAE